MIATNHGAKNPPKTTHSEYTLHRHRSAQNRPEDVIQDRINNLGYGMGVLLRRIWDATFVTSEKPAQKILSDKSSFKEVYPKIFPEGTLRIIYVELDPGVDDGAALLQLLAEPDKQKIQILGIVPCVGNAIRSQTELNTKQFLELTQKKNIPVFPGAISPLAIENNSKAILEMEKGINETHFYGHDGEEDVGGWPKTSIPMQKTPGFIFTAESIANASPKAPITLVSTSALTELAKTIEHLTFLEKKNKVPLGTYARKISAISIMGGCIDPKKTACNAPFNTTNKTSEANFYFDSPAARAVFAYCERYSVKILLSPLDLTQESGLLWTGEQNHMLRVINNVVSNQMAKVASVIPYIDAKHFPKGTYPMHDLFAAAALLYPEFFNVTRAALKIGNVGQIIINPHAPANAKNVYILSVPKEKQSLFYKTLLKDYTHFNPPQELTINAQDMLKVALVISVVAMVAFCILNITK